jgi:hypothetical protein
VAGNACVELAAAEVLYGNDVEAGVPVGALGKGREGEAVDGWWSGGGIGHFVVEGWMDEWKGKWKRGCRNGVGLS